MFRDTEDTKEFAHAFRRGEVSAEVTSKQMVAQNYVRKSMLPKNEATR